jgi:hypothetical protein
MAYRKNIYNQDSKFFENEIFGKYRNLFPEKASSSGVMVMKYINGGNMTLFSNHLRDCETEGCGDFLEPIRRTIGADPSYCL